MKRLLPILLLALLAICSGCATVQYPTSPAEVCGIGCDYVWDHPAFDAEDYCRALKAKHCTTTSIEFSGGNDRSVFKVGVAAKIPKYESLLTACRTYKILLIVSAVNDNKGSGKGLYTPRYGDDHNALSAYKSTCAQIMQTILDHGPTGQWVQVVAETTTDFGRELESTWISRFNTAGFVTIYNGGSRPSGPAKGATFHAYHPFSTSDTGNNNAIVIGDTGQMLNIVVDGGIWGSTFNDAICGSYAQALKSAGRGDVVYGFMNQSVEPDEGAMEAVGEAYNK
jgi:hypothetical protein